MINSRNKSINARLDTIFCALPLTNCALLHLTLEPWEYVICGGLGAYAGNKIPQWEAQLLQDVNEMRADRNMPPIDRVGGFTFGSTMVAEKKDDS